MAFSLIANTSAKNTTSGSINTTGADILVATVTSYASTPTISDSKTNTWIQILAPLTAGNATTIVFVALAPTVGTGHTFTATGSFYGLAVEAWSGSATYSSVIDANSAALATQAGSISPTLDNELIVAACAADSTNSATAINSSFTISDNNAYSAGVNVAGAMAYLVQTSKGAVNPTWTVSGGSAPPTVIASFKSASTFSLIGHTSAANTTTGSLDTTGANLIVVALSYFSGAAVLFDNKGNTYTQIGSTEVGASGSQLAFFYTANPNPIVGTGHTFSSTSGFFATEVQVWSGCALASPYDKFAEALATQAGSITPSQGNELIVAVNGPVDGNSATAIDSGFTLSENNAYTLGVSVANAMAYLVQGSASAINPLWTVDGGTPATFIASFLAASGGGGGGSIPGNTKQFFQLLGIGT